MYSAILMIVGLLVFASAPPPAVAAETVVGEPEASVQGQDKLPGDTGGVLKGSPGESLEVDPTKPEAVFGSGCIARPGGRVVFNLRARGTVTYRVVPTRYFDVTLQVTYVGLRSFPVVDNRWAGGAEGLKVFGPNVWRPVRVTIGGYRGSTGCFTFSATP